MQSTDDNFEAPNSNLQADEIEALTAIYEENFIVEGQNDFALKICSKSDKEVLFRVTLPKSYPLESPPIYEISAPWMPRQSKLELNDKLQEVYCNNIGQCIIHLWIVTITDFIERNANNNNVKEKIEMEKSDDKDTPAFNIPNIDHGEAITDKKSVFQAHLARITSEKQIPLILQKLKENRKILSATHNTYAYRILLPDGSFIEDCEDDGEKKAGLVLLRILQFSNLSNILIIVSRWYGGIHLGADRFKDYSNAATSLINYLKLVKHSVEPHTMSKRKFPTQR